jgi:hypothetical protein
VRITRAAALLQVSERSKGRKPLLAKLWVFEGGLYLNTG